MSTCLLASLSHLTSTPQLDSPAQSFSLDLLVRDISDPTIYAPKFTRARLFINGLIAFFLVLLPCF